MMCPSIGLVMKFLASVRKTTPIFDVHGRGLATAPGPKDSPPSPAGGSGHWGTALRKTIRSCPDGLAMRQRSTGYGAIR
jgi:hypothetical protein